MSGHLRLALLGFVLLLTLGAIFFALQLRGGGSGSGSEFRGVLDVNHASAAALDQVPWLSPAMAEGIVAGRPWRSVDELTRVSGIGEKTLAKIYPYLVVDD